MLSAPVLYNFSVSSLCSVFREVKEADITNAERKLHTTMDMIVGKKKR